MKNTLIILCALIFLASCSKEKSDRFVVLDVDVINADTGNPIDAEFRFTYHYSGLFTAGGEVFKIGSAKNGHFYKEVKVPRKATYFKLEYHSVAEDILVPEFGSEPFYKEVDFEIKSREKNKITIEVKPIYKFYVHLINLNCFDETDTLWVVDSTYNINPDYEFFTGCIDIVVGGPAISKEQKRTDYFKLKRNGIITYFSKQFYFDSQFSTVEVGY